jgi:hypothetical protein
VEEDINPWEAFQSLAQQASLNQNIKNLPPKQAIIARALTQKGVVVWTGIPQHIMAELERAGYKIKKKKKFLRPQRSRSQ